eukprot:TRINITY_DN40025_c0_g1_i1.p1 TRINITY_DN40025_c0_g1~~TRINITY_DN40025_c0_g1_i1.p1  ORF type:complete len:261 (+),score=40.74 TRINITY_DN40025_c0_g1_i1:36-818(+)
MYSVIECRLNCQRDCCFFLMIRQPPRSTLSSSSAASDVYKRQDTQMTCSDWHTAFWAQRLPIYQAALQEIEETQPQWRRLLAQTRVPSSLRESDSLQHSGSIDGTPGTMLELSPSLQLPLTLTPNALPNSPSLDVPEPLPQRSERAADRCNEQDPQIKQLRSVQHARSLDGCHVPPGGWWPHMLSEVHRETVDDVLAHLERMSTASPYRTTLYALARRVVRGESGLGEIEDLASGRPVGLPPGLWEKVCITGKLLAEQSS